jgi:hypothetical protein
MFYMQRNRQSDQDDLNRTILSNHHHNFAKMLSHKGAAWQVISTDIDLTQSFQNQKWVSLGSSNSRENLFFDTNTPRLKLMKLHNRNSCRGKSVREILEIVARNVDELTSDEVSPRDLIERQLEHKLFSFLEERAKALLPGESLNIEMDELIDKKILVCRHKGLIAAALIADLVQQQILPFGSVRQYRSGLREYGKSQIGAHVWAVFRDFSTGELWHCDPRWLKVREVNREKSTLVADGYGSETIDYMIKRLDELDSFENFMNQFDRYLQSEQDSRDRYFSRAISRVHTRKGTMASPGNQLCIELKDDQEANACLKQTLSEIGVKYDVAYHPNEFLIIRLLNNPVMIAFDMVKSLELCSRFMKKLHAKDIKEKGKEEQKEEEVAVFVEDPSLKIRAAEQQKNDLLFAQELDKQRVLEEDRQRQDLLLAEQLEKQFAEEIAKEKEQQLLEDEIYARSLALGS